MTDRKNIIDAENSNGSAKNHILALYLEIQMSNSIHNSLVGQAG